MVMPSYRATWRRRCERRVSRDRSSRPTAALPIVCWRSRVAAASVCAVPDVRTAIAGRPTFSSDVEMRDSACDIADSSESPRLSGAASRRLLIGQPAGAGTAITLAPRRVASVWAVVTKTLGGGESTMDAGPLALLPGRACPHVDRVYL